MVWNSSKVVARFYPKGHKGKSNNFTDSFSFGSDETWADFESRLWISLCKGRDFLYAQMQALHEPPIE
jgi:hypothetical protein